MIPIKCWVKHVSEKRVHCPKLENNLKICSLQVISSVFFFARCWQFQVDEGGFLLVVGRCRSSQNLLVVVCFKSFFGPLQVLSYLCRTFLAYCRLLQVVIVVSGCFLLVVCRVRLFLARCRYFQVVSGRFYSIQVAPGRFRSFRVLVSIIILRYRSLNYLYSLKIYMDKNQQKSIFICFTEVSLGL